MREEEEKGENERKNEREGTAEKGERMGGNLYSQLRCHRSRDTRMVSPLSPHSVALQEVRLVVVHDDVPAVPLLAGPGVLVVEGDLDLVALPPVRALVLHLHGARVPVRDGKLLAAASRIEREKDQSSHGQE